jgi:hypothetical protein
MPAGQPTKYNELVIPKLVEYILSCSREQTELPTIEGFANSIDVDPDTIDNWCKDHVEFFGAIKKLKCKQKNQLMNDGLYGGKEVNQAMAIFLLKANHGLIEKSAVDVTSGGQSLVVIKANEDISVPLANKSS